MSFSIYDGLVICHPKEHCTTWDFCTHYIPHVKGDACSCDSCVPCDMKTLLQHRVKMKEANITARDKWWIAQMETNFMAAIGCRLFPDSCDGCSIIERCAALSWQRFKNMLEVK